MLLCERKKLGFTLVELVVVIVIIGILAAIAIPRFSRGSTGASQSALSANLATIRNAVISYETEHNSTLPVPEAGGATFDQLTMFTDISGNTNATWTTTFRFGPYLLRIPPCPVGENAGQPTATEILVDDANSPPVPVPGGGEGWVYNSTTGEFLANTAQNDDAGIAFTTY